MAKCAQMTIDLRQYEADLRDHVAVENELAQRSHFSQKVIAKYKE